MAARATSRYKQVRLTFTEERGSISWRVMVKPLGLEWHERHTILVGSAPKQTQTMDTFEDVILALVAILEDQVLPRIHTT